MSEDKIGQKPAYSVYKERDDLRQEYQKVIGERDAYRDLCAELTNALHNHYWNDCTKHSRSIEALIYKAKSILGDSNAT